MSELKCCKKCGAFITCKTKGECCPECEWFDPVENICLSLPLKKKAKPMRPLSKGEEEEVEVDPDTFLFEDDDEDEDLSDLPPERDADEDDEDDEDFTFDDEDDDW